MTTHKIAVIAGDGIGQEVVPAALECLERIARLHSLDLQFTHFDWGSDYYLRHGRMMPEDGLEQLARTRPSSWVLSARRRSPTRNRCGGC